METRTRETLASILRDAIRSAPSLTKLSVEARVDRTRLRRFVRGEQGLTVDVVDRLLPILGLTIADASNTTDAESRTMHA